MKHGLPRVAVWVVGLTLTWGVLSALVLLEISPWRPTTALGWLGFAAGGPVVYIALEALGELTLGSVLSKEAEKRVSTARFSPVRILVALAVLISLSAAALAVLYVVGRPRP
jgi:hypothetical protein